MYGAFASPTRVAPLEGWQLVRWRDLWVEEELAGLLSKGQSEMENQEGRQEGASGTERGQQGLSEELKRSSIKIRAETC